jgi:aspartyl-tRNA(Asn)/glutamyl-tRNA(Gln) amidotransferase subunit B
LSVFQTQYQIPAYDADILTTEKALADYFESTAKLCENPKAASNWIMTELLRMINEQQLTIETCPISSQRLAKLIQLIDSDKISGKMGKTLIQDMWKDNRDPEVLVTEKGLVQISDDSAIEKIIEEVLSTQQESVLAYRGGKTKLFGFFVGQVMKQSKGQAHPEKVNELLRKNWIINDSSSRH